MPFFAFFLLGHSLALAGGVVWKPEGYEYAFLLPALEGKTAAESRDAYLAALEKNPELAAFASRLREASGGELKEFRPDARPVRALQANALPDLDPKPERMKRVLGPLAAEEAQTLIIPVAALEGATPENAAAFRATVNKSVDNLIGVGGDDNHPALYGRPVTHSVDTNLSRDRSEHALVKSYLEDGEGTYSALCRGHQMGGIAKGCTLIQDIGKDLKLEHPRFVDHGLVVDARKGSLTERLLAGAEPLAVNNDHHQAVLPGKNTAGMKVTAWADRGKRIAEITEYDGRGFSVQFHPELMNGTQIQKNFYSVIREETQRATDRRTNAPFRRIDLKKTLFGVEYTFQDQGMVDEPGRMTMETPHKRARFNKFRSAYLEELKLDRKALDGFGRRDFKPGSTINVPGDGKHVMNMEPVTIEVNTTPKIFDEIEASAEPIYRASREAKLVPYVKPAAERSGMGHVHVGGRTLGDSPFYRHPHLLRNMMAFLHNRPSVLWGFAEAYDIGSNSNIESHHHPDRQRAMAKAIKEFDAWYLPRVKNGQDTSDGLRQFLRALRRNEIEYDDFFHHYRFMNLEHLAWLADSPVPADPSRAGKYTVEFRNFRPPRSPQHAKANAELLLAMMDRQSEPGRLEPFARITPDAYNRFHSAAVVANDWEKVKRELHRHNPLWDETVGEYVDVHLRAQAVNAQIGKRAAEIYPAYSRKDDKGTKFELRIPKQGAAAPRVSLEGKRLAFEPVRLNGKEYWVSVFDAVRQESPYRINAKQVGKLSDPAFCRKWFGSLYQAP